MVTSRLGKPVTVPADPDEEAVEPHYAVPGVEVTVCTENLQVDEDSVTPKDYDDCIKKIARLDPADFDLPFSTWSLARLGNRHVLESHR
jgi:hypothetical protein